MKTAKAIFRTLTAGFVLLTLAGCLIEAEKSPPILRIEIANLPDGATEIETPDRFVILQGRVIGDAEVESITWSNDRGGKGKANGIPEWETGNIALKPGLNTVTVTASDGADLTSSQSISVIREEVFSPGRDRNSTDPIALYSYSSDLSNPAPVKGATIAPVNVYFYVSPGNQWDDRGIAKIKYLCCRGMAGPGTGTPHEPAIGVVDSPWVLPVDLSGFKSGGERRFSAFAEFVDGTESEQPIFDFQIGGAKAAANRPPNISGSPGLFAITGKQYSFRPIGKDPDGDSIRFTIQNKPAWAKFDEDSGHLYGSPGQADQGVYESIVISVSDGKISSSLSAFDLTIEPIGTYSATLNWTTPDKRTDGAQLLNLSGFKLYYGQSSRDYSNAIRVDEDWTTTYVVDNLTKGDWYFAITAIDGDGTESKMSNEVVRSY